MNGETVCASRLLSCLLQCAESSARLARVFRAEESVFGLLVEEKTSKEKNQRFVRDFKTLADVLVQVTIKRKIEQEFPTIGSKIQGEEQNSFENTLGDSIKVEISDVRKETVNLLCQVLEGNIGFAERIADVIYAPEEDAAFTEDLNLSFPAERIGIWIDPIDSTLEYIQGKCNEDATRGIAHGGLASVCVIIGAYDLETGDPVLGVVNQPFYSLDKKTGWISRSYWGLASGDERRTSLVPQSSQATPPRKVIVTSSSENETMMELLNQTYDVIPASGAGYKCLLVARGDADLYVLSQGSTYFWDTCGPHALLTAQGGGVLDFWTAVKSRLDPVDNLSNFQITYSSGENQKKPFQNSSGLLAYRDPNDAVELLNYIRAKGLKME